MPGAPSSDPGLAPAALAQRNPELSGFDFEAAVVAPFRMQPGLRRLAEPARHLRLLAAGSPQQREKLAVLSAYWADALLVRPGFDPQPALQALSARAALEHPQAWRSVEGGAEALQLGTAVAADGRVQQMRAGSFGVGDEITRCLQGLPPAWRLVGLMALVFADDLAIVDGRDGSLPWLAVCLPSHWAPARKLGLHNQAVVDMWACGSLQATA